MKALSTVLKDCKLELPRTVIQVGASGGQEVNEFVTMGVTDALLIEALDIPFSVLQAKVDAVTNYFALKALVHSVNGIEVDFYVASNTGMSSSILKPARHLQIYPEIAFAEKISLIGFRLDSIVAHLHSNAAIRFKNADLLYLDVQGAELIVLHGAGELLQHASYIWCEVGTGDGYSGAASYIDLIHYLSTYNFQPVYLECAVDGFGDALFVKRNLKLSAA
jgi:FkbM family methyltransferase